MGCTAVKLPLMSPVTLEDILNDSKAVLAVLNAIVESVAEAGSQGAPGGTLYAALMMLGVTFDQFNTIMNVLVDNGKLTKKGQLYYAAA